MGSGKRNLKARKLANKIKLEEAKAECALDLNNLQILCEDCNVVKINQWDTSWKS